MGECNANVSNNKALYSKSFSNKNGTSNNNTTIIIDDTTPPEINIFNYQLRTIEKTSSNSEIIRGKVTDDKGIKVVTVNSDEISFDRDGNFSSRIFLEAGLNTIIISAQDTSNNKTEKILKIERQPDKVSVPINTELAAISSGKLGRYFAIVIGNNNYRYLPKLLTAVNDAREVSQVLRQEYGFETNLLLNVERKNILDEINRFKLKLNENDNLLIYYAGHGVKDVSAYWLPVDARIDSTTEWIQAETITTELKKINAKHILVVSDSCYSGELSRSVPTKPRQGNRNFYLKKLFAKKSRTLIASGGNEPVADGGGGNHSIFSKVFINALKEPPGNLFTDDELFNERIKEIVGGTTQQTPKYSALRNSGHQDGAFIFLKLR